MMELLAWIAAGMGFLLLAGGMRRHAAMLPRKMSSGPSRVLGLALLGVSFALSLAAWPIKIAAVAWCGLLTLGAGIVVLGIAWRNRLGRDRQ
jgi:hypothetical protein